CNSLNIKDIKIVGYDSVPENIQCLKTGMIDFIISQRPEYQGAEALHNLFRSLMLQIDVPKKIDVPIDIITRENLP
ncbi:MAG: LacI family transcriptional regulator, partial [Spirochaetales bacterium]|nr:LacI family transcriptional regulator [Spirochaetales bacterium]MCF7939401.1 LacI family transcriptional regulator [Spirochaetales bacterium]